MSSVIATSVIFLLILISSTHPLSTKDSNVCRTRTGLECCFGYVLSQDKSKCEECPPGFYGNACKKECLEGQYGRLCDSKCHCTRNQICDKVVGCVLKIDVSTSVSVTVEDGEKKRTSLYETIIKLSTETTSPTNSSDATNQLKMLTSKQTTVVYYVIYSSSGALAMFSLLLLIAGFIVYKLKSSKNSTVCPIVVDESIYDDIGETDNTLMISNINRQEKQTKRPYLPPPRNSEGKDYDYTVYQSDDYLNPYNCIRKSEYSDHVYNGIIK